ncbi:MAG: superoxide dismutase [Nocardioidaceae bacterium]|nr:superoxide dismutase [Nocardioidaceae bacterium]NUS50662.1 superoxide dismutase [Nocardioidaceae bacterium]
MSVKRWGVLLAALPLALVVPPLSPAQARDVVDRIDLPVGWQPEGVTTDGKFVYSGSLATGSLLRANPRNGATTVLPQSATGKPAVGVDFDKRRDVIWVAGGPTGEIRVQKASNGKLLRTYTFPAGTRFINDLVVTRKAVYATDSFNAELGVVKLGSGNAKKLPPSGEIPTLAVGGDLVNVPGAFNMNGIVSSHGSLLVIQSNTGTLFRVDRTTGDATAVDTGGADLTNGDGLELDGDILYVVRNQNNEVAVVDLARDLASGELVDTITGDLDVPATVALVHHDLWSSNARFGVADPANADFWLTRLPEFDD